jgi:hypothetical protein
MVGVITFTEFLLPSNSYFIIDLSAVKQAHIIKELSCYYYYYVIIAIIDVVAIETA